MTPLEQKLEQLKLSTLSQHLEPTLKEAAANNLSFAATLESLLDLELEARNRRAVERRFKVSHLHAQPSIDSFHFQHHKSRLQSKSRILRLLDLNFLQEGTHVVLIGNPGTGKTYLAQILGGRACQANVRVLFTTAMDAQSVAGLPGGPFPGAQAPGLYGAHVTPSNLFYPVISTRHRQRKSTVLTTHTAFSEWGNILFNTTMATAIADRLVENSEIFLFGGESLRKAQKSQSAASP